MRDAGKFLPLQSSSMFQFLVPDMLGHSQHLDDKALFYFNMLWGTVISFQSGCLVLGGVQLFGITAIDDKAWHEVLAECDKNNDGEVRRPPVFASLRCTGVVLLLDP